jgi:3-deoxy-D-arabino-heptulosonate 7-phosphate (DAHP) synthase
MSQDPVGSSPKRSLILPLALVAAMIGALGLAV